MLLARQLPDRKELYITEDDCVKHVAEGAPMGQCNHEEVDTCILVHLVHALLTKSIGLIHTGDTDILADHQQIIPANPAADIWICFHADKSKRIINFNSIAENLGEETCKSLALIHALTGSDSTSAFKFKGKRSCWKILTKCTLFQFIQEFAKITDATNCVYPSLREAVANYVCQLYRGEVNPHNLDNLRMDIFSHKLRDVVRLPPTSDALHQQHLKRSVFQARIWVTANEALMPHHNPSYYGWKEDNGRLIPVWTTLSGAKEVFHVEILCFCKQPCSSLRCKCAKANLKCSLLCKF